MYVSRWRRATCGASGSVSIQISLGAEPQHPHVGLHVALAVEQRRVLALAGRQRLDVVGQLPLQVLGRVGAGDEQLAARRAVEQAALLAQLPVLGVELDGDGIGGHACDSRKRGAAAALAVPDVVF